MVRVALVGLGKMGISHLAILNAHRQVEVVAVCDTVGYVLSTLNKFTGVKVYNDYAEMLSKEKLDAVLIATPPQSHVTLVQAALDRGLHVFCEKPFALDPEEGVRLAKAAEAAGVVNQVGYHYRFVGSFAYLQRLLAAGAIGHVHHAQADAYGPVVLRQKTGSWRGEKGAGGGALYDYATHAVDLVNFCFGRPDSVAGASLGSVFSEGVDDEVYATLGYSNGQSVSLSVNWSDESYRKMSTKITAFGTGGKIIADRQETQIYLREELPSLGLIQGWNTRYTTELTEPVDFYLRGEEYSAQIDHFVQAIVAGDTNTRSTFRTAADADQVVYAIRQAAARSAYSIENGEEVAPATAQAKTGLFNRVFGSAR